jgi:protein-disulfide isomerase
LSEESKNNNNMMVPLAIVIAGLLVAGAVVYTNMSESKSTVTGNTNNAESPSAPQVPGEPNTDVVKANLINASEQLSLDKDKFSSCMEANNSDEVKSDLSDASQLGANGTPSFFLGYNKGDKLEGVIIVGALPYEQFKTYIDAFDSSNDVAQALSKLPVELKTDRATGAELKQQEVSYDGDPMKGDKNAKLAIVEFSDYECPFCQRFVQTTYLQILENYVNPGKMLYVFRDLPLYFHDPIATLEAVAANCAREQGGDDKYFEMHDYIFQNTKTNGQGV